MYFHELNTNLFHRQHEQESKPQVLQWFLSDKSLALNPTSLSDPSSACSSTPCLMTLLPLIFIENPISAIAHVMLALTSMLRLFISLCTTACLCTP